MPCKRLEVMAKYLNKFKIESTRLKGFDYTSSGSYFITICTKNRLPFFGKIINGKMILSEIGELAKKFWQEIPQHFPNAQLNEFIIMPDHMHGIICLSPQDDILPLVQTSQCDVSTGEVACSTGGEACSTGGVACSTRDHPAYLEDKQMKNSKMTAILPKPGSISVIIRSYKSVVSKYSHKINKDFGWQDRFHDRIIRNQQEFIRIALYIRKNPSNYKK